MRVYVPLREREVDALIELAVAERRRPQEQAAYLLARAIVEATRERQPHDDTPRNPAPTRDGDEAERAIA